MPAIQPITLGRKATSSLDGRAVATDTSNTQVIAAQGPGVRIYVTTLIVSNSSDTYTEVDIKSDTSARLTIPAPQKSGAIISLSRPLRLDANQALNFAARSGVSSITVSAVGYGAA